MLHSNYRLGIPEMLPILPFYQPTRSPVILNSLMTDAQSQEHASDELVQNCEMSVTI